MLIQQLQQKIRHVEATSRNDDGTIISSGCSAIDDVLPSGGYRRGTIIHWLAECGSAAEFLSLMAAKNAAAAGGAIVVINPDQNFYPPAAAAIGIQLGNLIVLQANDHADDQQQSQNDLLWAIDQSLRCSAVAAVWGELPEFKTPQLATRWQRRFQLSAEASGCCGMFIRKIVTKHSLSTPNTPKSHRLAEQAVAQPSHQLPRSLWAEIQWHLQSMPSNAHSGNTRNVRATLTRSRGGLNGQVIDLEINTITGSVLAARSEHVSQAQPSTAPPTPYALSVAAQLAHPKIDRRAERA